MLFRSWTPVYRLSISDALIDNAGDLKNRPRKSAEIKFAHLKRTGKSSLSSDINDALTPAYRLSTANSIAGGVFSVW